MNPADRDLPILVGIGLIERNGSYLIRQRLEGQAMAGFWEFPGGKCEAGESPAEATSRECLEEVGVQVKVGSLIHQVTHRYPHGVVALHYYRCRIEGPPGEPARDSGFQWVAAMDLARYRFPEANDAVIELLSLEAAQALGSLRGES